MSKQLKVLEPGTEYFECEGIKYTISKTLSFNRFEKLEEYNLEFGFSATFKDIFVQLRKQYDLLNQQKLADAIVLNHNLMKGIVNLEQKHSISFRICALFINSDEEDITICDEAKMNRKIDSWAKEYDVNFFLNFAISVIPYYLTAYNLLLKTISDQEKKN
jgi:hypothetical protein